MTTAVRIIDRSPAGPHRRQTLFKCFGMAKVMFKEVKGKAGTLFAIMQDNYVEEILKEENRQLFRSKQFEVNTPLEYKSKRTVVIKYLDRIIDEYSDEQIMESINSSNEWAQAELM